jgi:hypothetical protein
MAGLRDDGGEEIKVATVGYLEKCGTYSHIQLKGPTFVRSVAYGDGDGTQEWWHRSLIASEKFRHLRFEVLTSESAIGANMYQRKLNIIRVRP